MRSGQIEDLTITTLTEEYLGNLFDDDLYIIEETDSEDFLSEIEASNDSIWEVLEIEASEWEEAQSDAFLIF